MYTIYADGKALYSPNLANEGYGVINPKLTVELNKAGSLTFILPPNNVMYDSIQKLKTIITVMQDEDEVFRGRVLHDEKDFYNRKDIYCEGELSFLLDSIQRPYTFQGDIPDLFKQFMDNHNSQVDSWKQFVIGEITVTDSNDYINRENSDYSNTLDELNAKLVDTHGGYLRPRLQGGTRYLDYVEEYGKKNSQVIEFGLNMLDISEYISADEVFTVLIPLGAEQQDDEGNNTGRLTIASVNGGKDYIEDADAIALFGRIWKVQKWDDVTIADNLLTKGSTFLKNGIEMAVSLTMKAVDLHLVNVDTERIKLGDFIRVVSLPHKLDKYFLCSKISIDLVNADKTEFTLGVTFKALTEKQVNSSKSVQNAVVSVQSASQSAQESAGQANSAVEKIEQVIVQVQGDYVKTETFEAYQQEMNSKIASVYHVKGSVANYNSLPLYNRSVGDVWNLLDTGANYVWTDSGWDKLSETIDLSGYATKEELKSAVAGVDLSEYAKKTDIPTIPSKVSAFENDAEYVKKSELPTVPTKVSELENDSGYVTNEQIPTDYVNTATFEELVARVQALEGN